MNRFSAAAVIIIFCLLCGSCGAITDGAAPTTKPFTLKSNEELQGVLTSQNESYTESSIGSTRVFYSDSYEAEDVRNFFLDVVFGSSRFKKSKGKQLEKWSKTIEYFITGRYTNTDVKAVEDMARVLNSIDGFPGMIKADTKNDANLIINYGVYISDKRDRDEAENTDDATEFIQKVSEINTSGTFKSINNTGEIYEANIEISIGDATGNERSQSVSKEIMRICGMPFCSAVYDESIFAEYPYITGEPSQIDLIAFELLYNDKLKASCSFSECFYALDILLS